VQQESFIERIYRYLAKQTILVILAAVILIFVIVNAELFLSGQNIHNVARQISFDAIIAFGEVIVLIAGGIDLSIGSVLALSAALTMGLQPYGVGVAVGAALLMGITVGAVNGLLVTKGKIVPFIVTLGSMTVVYGVMLTYTKQQPIPGQVEWFTVFGNGSIGPIPIPTIIMLGLLVILHVVLTRTRFGRNMYAVGGNEEAAHQAGIKVNRHRFWAFVICGFCAALSGVLLASRLNSSTIHIGLQTPLAILAACIMGGASILGGRGSIIGAFWGVLTLGILSNGLRLLSVFTFVQDAIRALLFITVVAFDAFYETVVRNRLVRASAIGATPKSDALESIQE
jgi:ribose transport system permease protein